MASSLLVPAADVPNESLVRCDEIAYQFTAAVQPHIALLVADARTLAVVQASVNVAEFLDLEHPAVMGSALASLFAPGPWFEGFFEGPRLLTGLHSASGRPLSGRLLRQDGCLLLEVEHATSPDALVVADPAAAAMACQRLVDRAQSVEELAALLTAAFRAVTGYDRCVVYRFDSAWNGEVVGESRSPQVEEAYLGLHFPARDIPSSAREMMFRAGLRVTVDQQRALVPVEPRKNPVTAGDLDLTYVRGRGAAGTCRTYYGNLGVRSTLVVPLTVDGALWGMLSSHGARPLRPPAALDAFFELVGRMASNAVARLKLQCLVRAERAVSALFPSAAQPAQRLEAQLHALIPSAAFLLRTGGGLSTHGWSLDAAEASLLIDRLLEQAHGALLVSHSLAREVPGAAAWLDVVAGVLVTPLESGPGDAAVWLRPDRALTIRWAGDPAQGLAQSAEASAQATPRTSFKSWQQQVEGTAQPWSADEIELARRAAEQLSLRALRSQSAPAR